MFRRIALVGVLSAALIGVAVGSASATNREVLKASNLHAYPAKGARPAPASTSSLLTWHGGSVQHGTTVNPIFWGTSWSSSSSKVSAMDAFYNGVGGSKYANTNTEYTDSTGHVSAGVTKGADKIDNASAPRRAPSTGAVLQEVAKLYPHPTAGAYYPVYSDQFRGHAGYCAWHSSGSINGIQVQFGFFFNLDGDPGCDPGQAEDSLSSFSQGIAALGNVTGHELSEMLTDPQLNAWYDSSGAENADKCAWTFSGKAVSFGGNNWAIQGNFSNAAYGTRSGYDGAGCIDGN